jgi:hypothetical protein
MEVAANLSLQMSHVNRQRNTQLVARIAHQNKKALPVEPKRKIHLDANSKDNIKLAVQPQSSLPPPCTCPHKTGNCRGNGTLGANTLSVEEDPAGISSPYSS